MHARARSASANRSLHLAGSPHAGCPKLPTHHLATQNRPHCSKAATAARSVGRPMPVSAASPSDHALGALRALGHEQRLSLGGMLAVLLGRHAAWWDLEPPAAGHGDARFCATLLKVVMCGLLQLPADQFTALEPLARPPPGGVPISPEPFVASLPESPEEREEILHGLVVLMAVGVAATGGAGRAGSGGGAERRGRGDTAGCGTLGAGYDARSRQLLVECGAALGVPWSVMARREAELAAALASELRQERQAARREREAREAAARAESPASIGLATALLGKRWKRGVAVVGVGLVSGAAVAITAGLAAPAVLGGLAAVGGGMSAFGAAGAVVGTAVGSLTALLSGSAGVAVRGNLHAPAARVLWVFVPHSLAPRPDSISLPRPSRPRAQRAQSPCAVCASRPCKPASHPCPVAADGISPCR
eukprot:scaffold5671_cov105-Isochrysis_galbana.AAC.3